MASPINKRLPRDFKNNLGKYLGLFFMMILAVSVTSGFLLSASSIEVLAKNMREDYNVEDGRFCTDFEASKSALGNIEEYGLTVYDMSHYDLEASLDGEDVPDLKVRVYKHRTDVNIAAYAEGAAPQTDSEIALDRVFMSNYDLKVGDAITVGGKRFTISGVMTLPDYQALFVKNTDFIFNAVSFCVAEVAPSAYRSIDSKGMSYVYSFVLDDRAMDRATRMDLAEDILKSLSSDGVVVNDFIDYEDNQGIGYALDDVEGDQVMWIALLFILVLIMAFVFVVLSSATIEAESAIIGTLLASGYRKAELVRHYMILPVVIGFLACTVGEVLGFTFFSEPMRGLYYNSYSLPPFVGRLNPKVILITAVIPFVLLVLINLLGLLRKLRCTPLQFLRHETVRRSHRHNLQLPEKLKFTTRFRLRVFLRNLSHFVTLFFGIMFASLLLLFSFALLPVVNNYAVMLRDALPAEHTYMLKAPLEIEGTSQQREAYSAAMDIATMDWNNPDADQLISKFLLAATIDEDAHPVNTLENPQSAIDQAEKFAATSLEIERQMGGEFESITVYGIQNDSKYLDYVDVSDGKILATTGVLQKCKVKVGESALAFDRNEGEEYQLAIDGTVDADASLYIYMSIDTFNKVFDEDSDNFNGYFSDEALQLDERYLLMDMTPADMDKISLQMKDSMGSISSLMMGIAIPIYLILVYLLTKTVIDRSARAISYMKVFGYRNREVNKLYIRSITTTVIASLIVCLPIIYYLLSVLLKVVFMSYNGNFPLVVPMENFAMVVITGIVAYAVVAVLHVRRVRKVELSLAMKVQE